MGARRSDDATTRALRRGRRRRAAAGGGEAPAPRPPDRDGRSGDASTQSLAGSGAPLAEPSTAPLARPAGDRSDASTAQLARGDPGASGLAAGALVLDRYRLRERLGAGGFGVVWRAFDERLQREVAVKAVARERGRGGSRAEREALAAARLNHPGIVALYELGHDESSVYIVSELVAGSTLGDVARAGSLSDRDVARIGAALCDALAHAHARGVIHRDVKPGNVLVVDEPAAGAGFAKLADFGVAHLAAADGVTETGDVVGTLAYMAPEQAEGERVTPAADVYSLALTLFEGWTGTNPVRAATPAATARRLGRPLPPLGRLRRDLPAGLCTAIDAALDPEPARRPGLGTLRAALDAAAPLLSDEGGLVEPGALERAAELTRRLRSGRVRAAEAPHDGAGERLRALARRAGAGAGAGALALAAAHGLAEPPPGDPLALAGALVALVALLPRLGWLASAAAACTWLAATGRPGAALLAALALAPVPLLLPRSPAAWSVPALAPLLGAAGLGVAYPALAARARTAPRRAALGALGLAWLCVAELATGERLLAGPPPGAEPAASWAGSVADAASGALVPLATSGLLALALAWALAAVALPLLVRGRSLAADALAALAWAAGLVAAQGALAERLAGAGSWAEPRGALAGAALGALAAVALASLAAPDPGALPDAGGEPASSMGPR